ncbi:tetratricopeptide repeat protein [Marivita sp. GX14005]|uniref:tetratricopeptide repeat protein n=1 Tax=Marivita sp. GX14005 TaxID=2942276 RepID=UPI0020185D02|nr:tetratricopeptide repeat protein [Marivita sp. GX14005]MCL3880906.1 tetratricopeptide repeat protein [Marivita sp. GX14005]
MIPRALCALVLVFGLAACSPGGFSASDDPVFAPPADPRGAAIDQLTVGHRLMNAGEYELALSAFQLAAAEQGLTPDVVSALGSANLGLGRLGQAETLLRRAIAADEADPGAWNNLGVVLMERNRHAEAAQAFRRAFALDNGQSVAIRDNLRLALAKIENPQYGRDTEKEYKLVRRGSSDFLIRPAQ